ncbi:MAG: sugar phosphate isomerase/epimerase [Bacillati bacterium ANGP1]|uniref:Sugar phosphate isomerase/epimerase n=1 Tax=Candidatus Segetimicrobium genomatis TaxID=2569760 RepID=A0A537LPA2_9BACT|nr:MAG: sugar phosphate isomerase/epimerase [Terrabacteria group bacterium ANGP1]
MSNPVGIAVSHTTDLHGELTFFHDLGYDAVEISPDAFDLIFCGRLHSPLVNDVVPVLERHGFRYSVHSPAALDLRDLRDHELQVQMAESVVEFCRLIHAEVLVLHFEQQSADPAVEAAFLDATRRLADRAQDQRLRIGVENIEVERLAPVLEFVRRVDRPNVGLTFDVGHAFLAARHFGFDYLEAVRAARPLLIHLHVTDNFGRYDPLRLENFTLYRTQRSRDIFPVGRGDLHLPVGWGAIPYDQTFAALRGYQGSVITEYRYNLFRPHAQRLAQQLRSMVRRLGP